MWPQFNVKRPARRRMLTGAFLCLPFTNAPGKQPQAPAAIVLNALCYASYLSASTQLLCIISAFITLYPIPSTIISARSTSAVNPLTVVVTIRRAFQALNADFSDWHLPASDIPARPVQTQPDNSRLVHRFSAMNQERWIWFWLWLWLWLWLWSPNDRLKPFKNPFETV